MEEKYKIPISSSLMKVLERAGANTNNFEVDRSKKPIESGFYEVNEKMPWDVEDKNEP